MVNIPSIRVKRCAHTQEALVYTGFLRELCTAERARFGCQSRKDPGLDTDESER
jgi:hypothetical protein